MWSPVSALCPAIIEDGRLGPQNRFSTVPAYGRREWNEKRGRKDVLPPPEIQKRHEPRSGHRQIDESGPEDSTGPAGVLGSMGSIADAP